MQAENRTARSLFNLGVFLCALAVCSVAVLFSAASANALEEIAGQPVSVLAGEAGGIASDVGRNNLLATEGDLHRDEAGAGECCAALCHFTVAGLPVGRVILWIDGVFQDFVVGDGRLQELSRLDRPPPRGASLRAPPVGDLIGGRHVALPSSPSQHIAQGS